jgi:selenocysteine lyase/cysteine desulfurase
LVAAVQLQEDIGRARIAAHGRELATQLQEEFSRIDGLTLLTPRHDGLRASVTTIRHPRADAHRFFGYLLNQHRLRCRPVTEQDLGAVRISTHVFNSAAENERIIAAVRGSMRDL